MKRAKANGADVVKEWDSTMDSRTRDTHVELDGQIRELEEPFEIGGMKAMYPHGFGIASEDINCRCAVLERARWAIEDSNLTKNIDGDIVEFKNVKDYQDYKQKYFNFYQKDDIMPKIVNEEVKKVQYIGKLNLKNIGELKDIAITNEVVLTDERLVEHILEKHKKEYEQLKPYLKNIIENPDIIMKDNIHSHTIIMLKKIPEIKKNGRVVVKIAIANDEKHPKNSIITLMKLNDRTWKQTLRNRGDVIFEKR